MKIVHIIDSLSVGGAEQLLSGIIQALDDHEHTVVFLTGKNHYEQNLGSAVLFCLNYTKRRNTINAVRKLRAILKTTKPDVVHSHLPTSTYLARLVNYKNCPFFFTVHNLLSESIKKSKITWYLEKWLYRKNQHAIFVSRAIKEDYETYFGLDGPSTVLYNYIDNKFFEDPSDSKLSNIRCPIKFVSVGTLKEQKNHDYLIESFANLSQDKYQLDFIGGGPQEGALKQKVKDLGLTNIQFRLNVRNLETELRKYDYFILASKYEGFGIAPIEALALGLPLILSDISVLRETTNGNSIFFDISKLSSLSEIIPKLKLKEDEIEANIEQGRKWAKEMFSLNRYVPKLLKAYGQGNDSK